MPFKSQAQRRWAHTKEGQEALGGKKNVQEWNNATKGQLPERIGQKKAKPLNKKYHGAI